MLHQHASHTSTPATSAHHSSKRLTPAPATSLHQPVSRCHRSAFVDTLRFVPYIHQLWPLALTYAAINSLLLLLCILQMFWLAKLVWCACVCEGGGGGMHGRGWGCEVPAYYCAKPLFGYEEEGGGGM